jgi:hypothetical protein|tara:strand:- start:21339 stop:21476 length:138 start_codon:yes stop_codon:yes gene_type:complete
MNLEFAFHFPHDRFAIGWEYIGPDKEYNTSIIRIFLLILTITYEN